MSLILENISCAVLLKTFVFIGYYFYNRTFSIVSINLSFGRAPPTICGSPTNGTNKRLGMLRMPNTLANSCWSSISILYMLISGYVSDNSSKTGPIV